MSASEKSDAPAAATQSDARLAFIDRYLEGNLSGEMTLMYCLQAHPDALSLHTLIDDVIARHRDATTPQSSVVCAHLMTLRDLLDANFDGCQRIAAMVASGVDHGRPAASVDDGIAFSRTLFDWSTTQSSEASVALYSLGNPRILASATEEILALLRTWNTLRPGRDWLDIGCGIGRFEIALAPHVRTIRGIDVSSRMIATAREQCKDLPNVELLECSGLDLAGIDDRSVDVVLAVDSFPYLVQSGMALVERHFAEARRVLRDGGEFIILELSYRGLDQDRADVRRLAASAGFELQLCGEQQLSLWDGAAFHMTT